MTDFTTFKSKKKKIRTISLARGEIRGLVAILISMVLIFASFNGIFKALSFGKNFSKESWDGESPFAIAMNTNPISVFVYQNASKKSAFFTISPATMIISGDNKLPVKKLSDTLNTREGNDLKLDLTKAFGADIPYYVNFANGVSIDEQSTEKLVGDWSSFSNFFRIVFGKSVFKEAKTDIAQIDQLRLWWQLRSVRTKDISIRDFSDVKTSVLDKNGKSMMVLDSEYVNNEIKTFFENKNIVSKGPTIEIINASGVSMVNSLIGQIVETAGYDVENVENANSDVVRCQIKTVDKESAATSYLEKIFDCDIFSVPKDSQLADINLVIGKDISNRYFK